MRLNTASDEVAGTDDNITLSPRSLKLEVGENLKPTNACLGQYKVFAEPELVPTIRQIDDRDGCSQLQPTPSCAHAVVYSVADHIADQLTK